MKLVNKLFPDWCDCRTRQKIIFIFPLDVLMFTNICNEQTSRVKTLEKEYIIHEQPINMKT